MSRNRTKRRSIQDAVTSALAADASARQAAKDAKSPTLDSFVNFAQNLGVGSDNPLSSASYGFNPITRNRTLLEWVHRGSWLGGVAVDVVADDMTRAGVEIHSKADPDAIEKISELATTLGVWNSINDTIKWSRLYGGSLAVLLVDGQDVSTPLRMNTIRKGQFYGLMPLDRWMVEPSLSDLVQDYGPNFGMPRFYQVTAQAPGLARQRIHYSRVIRLEGVRLPYWQRIMENLWGLSILERLYDRMIAFDSATTGAAQLVYKSYLRTYKIEGMREIIAAGGAAQQGLVAYVDMMRRFQSMEGITLLDKNDEFEAHGHSAFSGLSDALQQFGQQLSGALQIPLVRLFGQSPAGFSTGDTDLRQYYDTIKQQQESQLRVGVTRVYRALAASAGVELPEGTEIKFRSLWQLTDQEKATVAQTVESAVSDAEEKGLITRATALKELKQSAQTTGIFSNISDEDITEAEQEGPPLPEDVEVAEIRATGLTQAAAMRAEGPPKTADKALPFAAGVLFTVPRDNKVLLLKRSDKGDASGTWATPGGHIESGETPEQAARREVFEETGHAYFGELTPLGVQPNGYVLFGAVLPATFPVNLNGEHVAHTWAELNRLPAPMHPVLAKVLCGEAV